ncbi:hypothetical protein INP02_13300, partial [Staphylococcus aureus]|nr:hypothetical protein [Staphylococcus aureus]
MNDQTLAVLDAFTALSAAERFEALQLMKLLNQMAPKAVAPEPKTVARPKGSRNRKPKEKAAAATPAEQTLA